MSFSKNKFILILVVATFFAYFSSLTNPFIWDDEQFIVKNVYVQSFDIGKIFTTNTIAGAGEKSNYYRPLSTLSFALDKVVWNQNPFGFHLTNLSLHIISGILLFFLLLEIGVGEWGSFFIALIFLVHPIQTEAVTYINSRGDSMYTAFLFGSLVLFWRALQKSVIPAKAGIQESRSRIGVRDDKIKRFLTFVRNDTRLLYIVSLILYALSILSKETAIAAFPLFFVLIFLHVLRHSEPSAEESHARNNFFYLKKEILRFSTRALPSLKGRTQDDNVKQALLTALGVVFCVIAYILLRLTALNFQNTLNYYADKTYYSTHLLVRLLTFARVLWVYLGLLIWPYPLHMERSVGLVNSIWNWEVWGSVLLVLFIIFLAVWEIRKNHTGIILFGFSLSACLLLPVSGIIPINGILYEHWLYVPMVGFFIMAYGTLSFLRKQESRWIERWIPHQVRDDNARKIVISFVLLLCILYIVFTIRQNNIWADPITFYRYTLSFAPNSARLHNNLGMSLSTVGDQKDAIAEYKKALSLGSGYPQIYNNLGNAQMSVGEYIDAEKNLKKALQFAPQFIVARNNLIKLYLLTKQYQKVRELSKNDPQVEKIIQELQVGH